ncbi:MAG: nuclear transport factor 2 family protein [Planctomycetota bacterium]
MMSHPLNPPRYRTWIRHSACWFVAMSAVFVCLRRQSDESIHPNQAATLEMAAVTADAMASSRVKQVSYAVQAKDSKNEADAITAVLRKQQAAWNRGDIDGFMEGYWKSEKLTFSSGGSTTRSWQSTIDRYKKKYNSREAMGTLTFDQLEVTPLADDAAFVLGRWDLKGIGGGNFTLVMRKLDSRWVVVHDHTSSLDDQ